MDKPTNPAPPKREAPKRATIKDVARVAGVSQSTTARALSGEGYVAAGVRERVRAAADELGYVQDAMASSLRKRKSRSIGVLVSDLRNPFYADLAAGIGRTAREHGYTMMLVDDRGNPAAELEAARAFVGMRVAGVIVTPASADVATFLLRQRVPLVEVDRSFAAGEADAVVVDNLGASRRLCAELLALGHRRIALLIDETAWATGEQRAAGYVEALQAAGTAVDPTLVVSVGSDVASAREATRELLAASDRPTAIFCANNVIAEGVWRATTELSLAVPADVSIVTFDDAAWMSMVTPGVTAVAQDAVALGTTALLRLLARIENPDAPVETVVLDAEIKFRDSTAVLQR